MTDDLTTRLRALLDRVPDSDAVIIDKPDMLALLEALAARDAVIAEARYEHSTSSLVAGRELCDGCHEAVPCTTTTILSRVPQGAAEPTGPQPSEREKSNLSRLADDKTAAEPWPEWATPGQDFDIDGNVWPGSRLDKWLTERAAVRRVAPDRETRDKLREVVAGDVLGGWNEHHCIENQGCTICAGNRAVDALLASGVLGVPADPTEIDGLHEQYPEVAPFVTRMLRELWANRGKGDQAGWRAMTLRQAWSEIAWHTGKMTTAIKTEDWALVRELAADIANGAMMLDDILQLSAEYRKAAGS